MKLWAIYINGAFVGSVDALDKGSAIVAACDKFPVKLSDRVNAVEARLNTGGFMR